MSFKHQLDALFLIKTRDDYRDSIGLYTFAEKGPAVTMVGVMNTWFLCI